MDFKYQIIAFVSILIIAGMTSGKRTRYYNVSNHLRKFKQIQKCLNNNPYKK